MKPAAIIMFVLLWGAGVVFGQKDYESRVVATLTGVAVLGAVL